MALAIVTALLIAGCGGSSGGSSSATSRGTSTSSSATGSGSSTTASSGRADPTPLESEGKFASFGVKAPATEREAVTQLLEENFTAREGAEWAQQCRSLSPAAIKNVETEDTLRKGAAGCPAALREAAEPLPESELARTDTLSGPIAVLRVKGDEAFALYHGTNKKDNAVPLEKVGGKWLVAALVGEEISSSSEKGGAAAGSKAGR